MFHDLQQKLWYIPSGRSGEPTYWQNVPIKFASVSDHLPLIRKVGEFNASGSHGNGRLVFTGVRLVRITYGTADGKFYVDLIQSVRRAVELLLDHVVQPSPSGRCTSLTVEFAELTPNVYCKVFKQFD
jgi:hypothetical protein